MTQKARIYVPTNVAQDVTEAVKRHLANMAGGFTVIDAQGGWINDDGKLIEEPVRIIEAIGLNEAEAKSTAAWIQSNSDEQEVLWEINEIEHGFQD